MGITCNHSFNRHEKREGLLVRVSGDGGKLCLERAVRLCEAIKDRNPTFVAAVELGGVRTFLAVPMMKENELIGVVIVCRQEVRPFSDKQIEVVIMVLRLRQFRSGDQQRAQLHGERRHDGWPR